MIPERVTIQNFLTYGEDPSGGPIVFDFTGAQLWSIGGDNGAGKSTIFDAIRYCLFGEHRGGSQNDNRLVRKGTNGTAVEFHFRFGDHLYRIRRTITLSTTRKGELKETKAAAASVWDDEVDAWVPIPEADGITPVTQWVKSLGLRSDAFNATVLLQQGGADKLLTEPPKKRFEIFSSIIDLAPYERLAAAATGRQKDATAQAKALTDRRDQIPAVTDEQLTEAETAFENETTVLNNAIAAEKEASAVLAGARRAADLDERLTQLATRRDEIEALLAEADAVSERFARHQSLAAAEPKLTAAETAVAAAEEAEGKAAEAQAELDDIDIPALERARDEAADAVAEQEAARDALLKEADAIGRALPVARALITVQGEVTRRQETADETGSPEDWQAELERRRAALNALDAELEKAKDSHADLLDAQAKAQAQMETVTEAVAARREAAGEATCSRCGQAVDADHVARELADLEAKHAEAARHADTAKKAATGIASDVKNLTNRMKTADTAVNEADKALQASRAAADELRDAIARLAGPSNRAAELPEPWPRILAAGADAIAAEAAREETLRTDATSIGVELKTRISTLEAAKTDAAGAVKRADELQTRILLEQKGAEGFRREADAHLSGLASDLVADFRARRSAALNDVAGELESLADAPDAYQALRNAQEEQAQVSAETKAATTALGEIPVEHRIPIEDAEVAAEEAAKRQREAQALRDEVYTTLHGLQSARKQRDELACDMVKAEHAARVARKLATLLGRSGLQAQLMRQAVEGVETLANDTLSRLSGGALSVDLRCGEDREGSKLEVWVVDTASADEPLEANFVSGSQKFRVAVAIAAGLGQYLAGPEAVRSLIIDEGFGSLDESGREVMITELRNLAEHLERVIVVSHHTDFSDPARFPNTFTLRKIGRHTEVTRRV